MRSRYMYVNRRRRRPAVVLISLLLGLATLAVVGGAGFGAYRALSTSGVVPTVAIRLGPPTSTPPPTATPVPMLAGIVTDAYTGRPLPGVAVTVGGADFTTGADGAFRLPRPATAAELRLSLPAYEPLARPVGPTTGELLSLALRPTRLEGVVRGGDGKPLASARVTVGTTTVLSEADGRYTVQDVPESATLTVEAPDHARHQEPVGKRATVDVRLRVNGLTGVVKSKEGQPIARATVALGDSETTTGSDGRFKLTDVSEEGSLAVKAGGFKAERRTVQAGSSVEVTLTPLIVKAIYLTHLTVADDKRFNELLALVKRTELNAMVIDVKGDSGHLFYDSKVPLAREIGAVEPAYDVGKRLRQLREANVYTIARQVIMEDTLLAKSRPQWAVRNKATGRPWKDFNGIAWMNPYRPEIANYNVAIAKEVAELGFDEVQFDYIRFPSDGQLELTDYGQESNEEKRRAAIAGILSQARRALAPSGVFISADLFGLVTVAEDDLGIGQKLESVADVLDYICPMVYPSHYARGSFGYANPAAKPYEVVEKSLAGAKPKLAGSRAQLRPWLQDFDLYGTDYTPEMVRAQIKAAEEHRSSGWLLWNAANRYQEAALRPRGR